MPKTKVIRKPEKLYELFEAYRKEVKDNPRIKVEYVGKEGNKVKTPIERALTVSGFKTYCYKNICDAHHYFDNPDGRYDAYRGIVTRIREEIKEDQLDGAMVNQYNSNLTARLNGISDKQQMDVKANVNILNIDPLVDRDKD